MPLDGLRAWIAEVEHKLTMRTRVFLALAVIAIGGAGAGIYLAIDAREDAVSKSEVQTLQEELSGATGGESEAGAEVVGLKAELEALRAQVQALESENGAAPGGTNESDGGSASPDSDGEGTPGGASAVPETVPKAQKQLREKLEETKKSNKAG
jgi:hypothetical protein